MKTENPIEQKLTENIFDQNVIFVFSTGLSADLWADRATKITGATAVASERFKAWDDFKGKSIRGQKQDKTSIPSTLRDIFSSNLILQNSEDQFLKSLIVPRFAKESSGFTNWISSLLPGLRLWGEKKLCEIRPEQKESIKTLPTEEILAGLKENSKTDFFDDEDCDFLEIFTRYNNFLNQNGLFDPAWETPPFKADGKKYILFYPEILSDWIEYENILKSSPEIEIVNIPPEEAPAPSVDFYKNSRSEIRNVALYIRKLHDEKGINWTDIAVNVPDMKTYAPYIQRDFKIYGIPNNLRNGKNLSESGAGAFFKQILDCVQNKFSFESLKNLLLNTELPWLKSELNSRLIEFGKINNCICSYEYSGKLHDSWEEAFSLQGEGYSEDISNYYTNLKRKLTDLCSSDSFDSIRTKYFAIRNSFFNMDECPLQSDLIISRCVAELGGLSDLEKSFPNCKVPSPYTFYVKYLEKVTYLAQSADIGVAILPYKLASTAPFKYHVVIDASQASTSVIYKQLGFLSDIKRKKLGIEDPNISDLFLRLYSISSTEESYYTCSEQTFSGYALPAGYLEEKEPVPFQNDFIVSEKNFLLQYEKEFPKAIFEVQKKGFEFWEKSAGNGGELLESSDDSIEKAIKESQTSNDKLKISYSNMNRFFTCPRLWLFEYVFGIEQQNNDAELMDHFAMGNLYHKILEVFCKKIQADSLPLKTTEDGLSEDYKTILYKSIDESINNFRASYLSKELIKTTKASLTATMEFCVHKFSEAFAGCKVVEVEKYYEFAPEGKNYFCNGKIDCLLKNEEEAEFILVDFKSTKSAIHKEKFFVNDEVQIPDFQMPIYTYLLENQKVPKKIENAVFFNIKDGEVVPVFGSLVSKEDHLSEFKETRTTFENLMEVFAERIKNHDFGLDDKIQNFDLCHPCKNKGICRRTFNVSRKD